MKRGALCLLMMVLLLTGCSSGADRAGVDDFQNSAAQAQSISFTADVRAEFDDKTENYTFKFQKSGGEAVVEVVKPEILAGIKAHIKDGGSTLEYDGASLDTGGLGDSGLTPVTTLPELMRAAAQGHIDSVWREGGSVAAQITPDDAITATFWFDGGMKPYHAEIQSSGKVLVYCDIIDYKSS